MRRHWQTLLVLLLCGLLVSSPALLATHENGGAGSPVEPIEPAGADERCDPSVDERNEERLANGAGVDAASSRSPADSRQALPAPPRHDDPVGASVHGLRAPPQ